MFSIHVLIINMPIILTLYFLLQERQLDKKTIIKAGTDEMITQINVNLTLY